MYSASVLRALLLALLVVCPRLVNAGAPFVLPESRVFPGNDGASPATLDQPLRQLVAAWKQRTGNKTFRKRVVIHKSRRRMDVFADGDILKSYLVELGPSPVGDKRRQGDMRTPEGDLYVCTKNRVSQFTRFFGLSYPHPASARAAVGSGLVSAAVEKQVLAAYQRRDRCPPQSTRMGGAVGIHGAGAWERRGDGYVLVDWTWGCVGLRDVDILELFEGYLEVGVPVRIEPD